MGWRETLFRGGIVLTGQYQPSGHRDNDLAQEYWIGIRAQFENCFAHNFAQEFIGNFKHAHRGLFM